MSRPVYDARGVAVMGGPCPFVDDVNRARARGQTGLPQFPAIRAAVEIIDHWRPRVGEIEFAR